MVPGDGESKHAADKAGDAGVGFKRDPGTGARVVAAAVALAADIGLEGGGAFADVVQPARNPSSFFPAEGFRELRSAIAYSGEMMRQRLPIISRSVS